MAEYHFNTIVLTDVVVVAVVHYHPPVINLVSMMELICNLHDDYLLLILEIHITCNMLILNVACVL